LPTLFNFSINSDFWINLNSNSISIGHKDLPEHIHYTISLNEKSPFANFHVTKNVSDQNNKPQIKILQIKFEHLEDVLPKMQIALHHSMFQEFELSELQEYYPNDLGYLSLSELKEEPSASKIEKMFIDIFQGFTEKKRNGKEINIKGNFEELSEDFTKNEDLLNHLKKQVKEFNPKSILPYDTGFIVAGEQYYLIRHVYGHWYLYTRTFNFFNALEKMFGKELYNELTLKIEEALAVLKNAQTYADVCDKVSPIIIGLKGKQ
jgi:hypothetical protein